MGNICFSIVQIIAAGCFLIVLNSDIFNSSTPSKSDTKSAIALFCSTYLYLRISPFCITLAVLRSRSHLKLMLAHAVTRQSHCSCKLYTCSYSSHYLAIHHRRVEEEEDSSCMTACAYPYKSTYVQRSRETPTPTSVYVLIY